MPLWGCKAQPLGGIRQRPDGLQGASLNRCKSQHFLGMKRTFPYARPLLNDNLYYV